MSLLLYQEVGIATTYTLSCSVGSFTEVGQASLFQISAPHPRKNPVTNQVNGNDMQMAVSSPMIRGQYVESGKAAAVRISTPAVRGLYTEVGQALAIRVSSPASSGTFGKIGKAEVAIISSPLVKGSYAVTGYDLGLFLVKFLVCEAGSYSVVGKAASFKINEPLAPGSYSIVGQAAGLYRAIYLVCDVGSYSVTGHDLGIRVSAPQVPGFYSVQGFAAGLAEEPAVEEEHHGAAQGRSYIIGPKMQWAFPLRYQPGVTLTITAHQQDIHVRSRDGAVMAMRTLDITTRVRVLDAGNASVEDGLAVDVSAYSPGVRVTAK